MLMSCLGSCRRVLVGALAVAVAAVAVGCGSGSGTSQSASSGSGSGSSSGSSSGGQLTTVKIGVLPISALAPVYLGIQQGIFQKHGLKLEPQVAQSGAAIVPAVVSGQQQFGFANVVSLMIAHDKGLPVRIVAQGSQAGPGPSSRFEGVIVRGSSPIKTPADLAGKTIAVNALNDIGGLLISGALQKKGVDPKSIKFTEVGFPDVNAAVDAKRVDAGYQTEPFLTQAQHSGDRVVLYQYPTLGREITIATYFTTASYIASHKDVVDRFRAAMNEALSYASSHQAAVRKVVTTYTKIPDVAAQHMILPGWDTSLDPNANGMSLVAQLATQQGLVKQSPDMSQLIAR